jgi:hypothetical protein
VVEHFGRQIRFDRLDVLRASQGRQGGRVVAGRARQQPDPGDPAAGRRDDPLDVVAGEPQPQVLVEEDLRLRRAQTQILRADFRQPAMGPQAGKRQRWIGPSGGEKARIIGETGQEVVQRGYHTTRAEDVQVVHYQDGGRRTGVQEVIDQHTDHPDGVQARRETR